MFRALNRLFYKEQTPRPLRWAINLYVMKLLRLTGFALVFLASVREAPAQGFVNLNFDDATITTISFPGRDRYTATVPGWAWNTPNYVNGDPNSVPLNDIALDAPAVSLQGTNSPFFPSLRGTYSVLLQGGTTAGGLVTGNTNGASVFQTGQIPITSRSLIYLGGEVVRVAFEGEPLTSVALGHTASYTVWGVDIAAYAGQSGELRFTAPWQSTGMLDGIQFSPTTIPEPGVFALGSIIALCLLGTMRRPNRLGGTTRRFGSGRFAACQRAWTE